MSDALIAWAKARAAEAPPLPQGAIRALTPLKKIVADRTQEVPSLSSGIGTNANRVQRGA
jgi:hypothetical protein